MPSLLTQLTAADRRRLFDDLNYVNLAEMRGFCRAHGIPWAIMREEADGTLRRTSDIDRKSVVLDRVRTYLKTGRVPGPTVFRQAVLAPSDPPPRFRPSDRLYYGWYDKHDPALVDALEALTGGAFKNGAVARILCREFWTAGTAPTLREYAEAWMEADARGLWPHPEAAYLTDRAAGRAGSDWKAERVRRATAALAVLAEIAPNA